MCAGLLLCFAEDRLDSMDTTIELEGFRQIGSFIVVCEQLIVCVQ